jgi:predicted Zn-dependent peptidase
MRFEEIVSERLNEKYYIAKHPSGLTIMIIPKSEYSSTYAIFGTNYGSIDNRFRTAEETGFTSVPEGIAHFLEHKLFESEDGDAFTRYAATGASANAYTSFDTTAYLFSCTENFYESFEILLDFVQSPYFTKETVEKEQGIIGQEIRMYEDDPNWRVFFNMLSGMYHNHPVKLDIAGTTETISRINADLLYRCYKAFYNLSNMFLCVCGDVDYQKIYDFADKMIKPNKSVEVFCDLPNEPQTVAKKRVEQYLPVSVPLFRFGFKDNETDSGYSLAKRSAITEILLEIITGEASPLYNRLYDSGMINVSFESEYFCGRSFAATIVGGESRDPDAVLAEFVKETQNFQHSGLANDDFIRAKRTIYARATAKFDSIDKIANSAMHSYFSNIGLFDFVEAVAAVTLEDVEKRLKEHFDAEKVTMSIVFPVKN